MPEMSFEIYSEESNVIGFYDYTMICAKMSARHENCIRRQGHQRSIYFNQDINYLVDTSEDKNVNHDRYSINIYDRDIHHMILNKQSNRDGTIYRQYTYLTVPQCESIIHKDISWMKDSDQPLFRDLYLEMTINQKWPGVVVDCRRQVFGIGRGGDYLIFDREIESTYDIRLESKKAEDLAGDSFAMEPRLEPQKVVMTYRQGIGMPKVLTNIIDMSHNYRAVGN